MQPNKNSFKTWLFYLVKADDHPMESGSSLGFFLQWEFFLAAVIPCCSGGFTCFSSDCTNKSNLFIYLFLGRHCSPIWSRSLWKTSSITSQFIFNLETLSETVSYKEQNTVMWSTVSCTARAAPTFIVEIFNLHLTSTNLSELHTRQANFTTVFILLAM